MKRSKHSLSNYKLLSMNMGQLVPIGLQEVLPGDTFQHSTSALVRVSPLVAPVMHPVTVNIRHFFVPNRLLWDGWEDFITGGPDGRNTASVPVMHGKPSPGDLGDYLGLPASGGVIEFSALPFRAYAMIWNEFFRDQDLQAELPISKDDGLDQTTPMILQHVNWEKDYFTKARPWEQKGPAITIPLGNQAAVRGDGTNIQVNRGATSNASLRWNTGSQDISVEPAPGAAGMLQFGANTGLYADLSGASAVTVNLLREAFALQRYEEARARFGSRYTEYLRYLGINSSDARMQRPEYLGGGRENIQFSEVLQTAEGVDPVGDLKGHGIAAMRSNRYRRYFEEHGWVISLMHVRPKGMYMQGLPRHWSRKIKEDYWQRELQHIGQQEILNKELYIDHPQPEGTFGFGNRYDEYRETPNTVAGEFQTPMLDYWHMARRFGSAPALNDAFVTCNPTDRIFASPNTDTLYVMARHSIQARRIIARSGESYIY